MVGIRCGYYSGKSDTFGLGEEDDFGGGSKFDDFNVTEDPFLCTYLHASLSLSIYIYIYNFLSLSLYIYIYIYIYMSVAQSYDLPK